MQNTAYYRQNRQGLEVKVSEFYGERLWVSFKESLSFGLRLIVFVGEER